MSRLELYYIDKNVPVPFYYQLKQQILDLIDKGVLQVGDMLPTENELCENLQVSRPTVRQALSELVSEGRLTRQKGKGTFVSQPKIDDRFLQKLESFNHEMLQKGLVPSTKVLSLNKVPAIEHINEKLRLAPQEPLIHLVRLRYANNVPVVYLETYVPYNAFPELMEQDFFTRSLYELLDSLYAAHVAKVNRVIEAVNATRNEAELLQIDPGTALCLVTTIGSTTNGDPVEFSVARYRGDRTKFSVELYR